MRVCFCGFFFLVVLPWHPFFLFLAPLVFKNPPGAQVASRDPSVPKGFTAPASSSTSLAFLSLALTFAFALRIFALPFGLSLQGVVIGWVCITFTFFLLGLACPCPLPLFPFCLCPPCQHLVPSIGSVGLGQGVVQSGAEVSFHSVGCVSNPKYQRENLGLACRPWIISSLFGSSLGRGQTTPKALVTSSSQASPLSEPPFGLDLLVPPYLATYLREPDC